MAPHGQTKKECTDRDTNVGDIEDPETNRTDAYVDEIDNPEFRGETVVEVTYGAPDQKSDRHGSERGFPGKGPIEPTQADDEGDGYAHDHLEAGSAGVDPQRPTIIVDQSETEGIPGHFVWFSGRGKTLDSELFG